MRFLRRLVPVAAGLALAAPASLCAHAQEMAVVSTRVIYPGQVVTADALEEVPMNWHTEAAIVRVSAEIEGKVASRTLLPGRLIPEGSVREPYLVESGKPVTVTFEADGLTIATKAVSLQSGAAGDMIRLRNVDSGAVLTGIVLDDGTVRVGSS